jgi:hypothetical protein
MDNAPHLPDSDFVCKHADKEAEATPHAFRLHHYYEQSRLSSAATPGSSSGSTPVLAMPAIEDLAGTSSTATPRSSSGSAPALALPAIEDSLSGLHLAEFAAEKIKALCKQFPAAPSKAT